MAENKDTKKINKDTRKLKDVNEYTTSLAKRKANNKFSKQNYETVGYKCKKGIKSILEIVAKNAGEKSVSKLVEKAVIEYVAKIEQRDVLDTAEKNALAVFKKILQYDEDNKCLYPKNQFDYLLSLQKMYKFNRKNKTDCEVIDFDFSFLKPYNEDFWYIENPKKLYELVYYANSIMYNYNPEDEDEE
jgi:hypothetical protein